MSHVIDQIYDQITELFPNGENQRFCMEFPGRVLNETDYAYDINSIYSILTKPQPVVEAEFRLVDDLFDIGDVVGGPNGKKMATSYETALNMLAPLFPEDTQFDQDKSKIRNWLLEVISIDVNGDTMTGTRMELYEILYQNYLDAKSAWAEEKSNQLESANQAQDPESALEEYAKWLAREAPLKDAQQQALFADLVVRGYYHKIRYLLSLLDIKMEGEQLEEAKENMRNSSMSSLDECETIYPVQLQPSNWFKSLSTDFIPEDLLLSPDFLQDKLVQKENQMEDLQLEYQMLKSAHTGDEAELQKAVDDAQAALDDAQTQLIQNFGNATISLAQIYFDQQNKKKEAVSQADFNELLAAYSSGPLDNDQWEEIKDLQNVAISSQQTLTDASRALTQLQTEKASAITTDSQQELLALESQMNSLQREIDDLTNILLSVSYSPVLDNNGNPVLDNNGNPTYQKDTTPVSEMTTLPDSMPPVGEFFDVTIAYDNSTDSKDSTLSSGSSQTSWNVDVLFGSAGGSSSETWSQFNTDHNLSNTNIEIGFRATKVTIDRGGWFNPQLFGLTKDMFKVNGESTVISNGPLPLDADEATMKNYNSAFFPAYPVAFVIAKDVTMKFTFDSVLTSAENSLFESSSSVSGGFLCFGASHSESSSSHSQSYYHETDGTQVVIKIPGPQILGWFVEFVDTDESKSFAEYVPMPDGFLPEDNLAYNTSDLTEAPEESNETDVQVEEVQPGEA